MNATSLRQDARVIGLVGTSHGVSHFFHLILAGLFPWLKEAFSLSYSELGLLMTVFFVISGIGQALSGFVVDRVGARRVLFTGHALLGVGALVLASAPSYAMLLLGSFIAGCGNAVFHPAGYTLLNHGVSKERLAYAFSVHGISGNIGWATAPIFLAGVATLSSWRVALLAASAIPALMLLVLFLNRAVLPNAATVPKGGDAGASAFGFLRLPAVWMCFGFFFLTSVALGGIQAFSSASLTSLYGISLATAATAYTTFMLSSAAGMVAGGFLAARAHNHDRTIAICFLFAAALALLLSASVVPGPLVVLVMGAIGLSTGVAGPSRDLLIRAAAPPNATGRVFGVVYSGLDSGMAVGPVLFGMLMDGGHPAGLFIGVALFQTLAIATAVGAGGRGRAPLPHKA
ncbi:MULTISPECIES: MFS transporter [unclassified Massilia]|uniref:MFS transporter n=1 Tax=unclassified Massilia TaxID=2609279 RepID=UPI0017834EE1|nr:MULTISPECIES: MFS transporter [unclassified Massilia]MBD8530480.1 MFS transporter [Massilia sp. CFBP 13647]MBD8674222.1 MFS transporter [Massilia sp. CFBP 13721]